jgi:hypothetical protein
MPLDLLRNRRLALGSTLSRPAMVGAQAIETRLERLLARVGRTATRARGLARQAGRAKVVALGRDEWLAAGVDTRNSVQLRQRASKLTATAGRRQTAEVLERFSQEAERIGIWSAASPPLQRSELRAARPALEALVTRLRDEEPVSVQGAALARLLVTANTSPIYEESAPGSLELACLEILRVLDCSYAR